MNQANPQDQSQVGSDDSQQAQAKAAVEELQNDLDKAQKELDSDLAGIKKDAMKELEKASAKKEEATLNEVEKEITEGA